MRQRLKSLTPAVAPWSLGRSHLGPAAVAHGNLTVTVDESLLVSQPGPFARVGETAVVPESQVVIEEEEVECSHSRERRS